MEIKKITDISFDFIIDYCKSHGEVQWLKETAHSKETRVKKDGTQQEQEISMMTLRSMFAKKFFPLLVKPTKENFRSIIDAL